MLSASNFSRRNMRYVLSALMITLAFSVLLAPIVTRAASPSMDQWHSSGRSDALANLLGLALPTWSANVRANTDTTGNGQHEPSLAVSPANPNVVVIANKDYREGNIKHVWIEASRDGGQSWPTQLRMTNGITTDTESDPVVIARDDGRIYVSCLTTGNNGVFITWSDDNGVSWQPAIPIVQNQSSLQDKDWFAVDNNPSSPYYHRVYMAWAPGGVVSSYSTDGGLTWSTPQQIPNNGTAGIEYPYPVVAPNGDVFIFHMYDWGVRGASPSIVKVVKSTNGGVTWSQPVSVATIYQPNSPPRTGDDWRFFSIISAATDPTNNNRLYAAWTDNRNINTNGLDVQYSSSTDHGTSWGAITRLSHDPTGVVRDHITPILNVSADGRLNALWLDRRLDASNHLFQAWYSSSTDGGTSWEADSQVSDAPGLGFDLNVGLPPGSGNAAGDYWGLGSAGGYVYAAWTDTRNGEQDIYTSRALRSATTPTPSSTPTQTFTSTPTRTPTAAPVLVGHVTWQGRPAQPNALQQVPVTLTLKLGTTEVNYATQTTDANGFFTVSVGSLASGTYSWRVKGAKWLANSGSVALTGAPNTNAEMGLMRTGDTNNDNIVNTSDFSILKITFGKTIGDPGYDARADFNGDNAVNTTDFNLLKNNFGLEGAPPI